MTADEHRRRFDDISIPIMESGRVQEMSGYIQHGTTSTLDHVTNVAWSAFMISRRLRLAVDDEALVRGAILHDYYLYDWHDGEQAPDNWHGFTHPGHALRNAESDFDDLTATERDIISHHMFPLHPVPPWTCEGWLVCVADKICAVRETLGHLAMRKSA